MPRQITELQVFVASPSDVDEERHILETVIEELNTTWSDTLGVRLKLLSWRTHAVPGVGRDAQDVINRSIPEDYDIFIGIMWSRFGTPTTIAGSGTEEEFDRAFARYRSARDSVRLMFYFKDDPVAPSHIDPEQLGKVAAFKRRLAAEGVLFWPFTGSFDTYVRLHLARQIQEWVSSDRDEFQTAVSTPPPSTTTSAPDEEPGMLDALDGFFEHFESFAAARQRLLAAVDDMGSSFRARNAEIPTHSNDLRLMKRLANRAADDMEAFVVRLSKDIPVMTDEFDTAMQNLAETLALASEFTEPAHLYPASLRHMLRGAVRTLRDEATATLSFRETVATTPRLTTHINRAKRRTLDVLDQLVRSFGTQRELLSQVVASFPAEDDAG
jgi:hypothetical protein